MDNSEVIQALRIRPLVPRERAEKDKECIRALPGLEQVILGNDKNFSFNYVFAQSSPQVEIFETSVKSLLTHLYKGYNVTGLRSNGRWENAFNGFGLCFVVRGGHGWSNR
jgi:kinesin family member 4